MKEDTVESSHASTADFMETFLDTHSPPSETIQHFRSVPWLSSLVSSPKYKVIPIFSRHLKSSGEDYFFSRTVNTEHTIPHMVTLQLRDLITPEPDANQTAPTPTDHRNPTVAPEHPDAITMLALSGPGLNGHPETLHGGMTCAILDETMGVLIMLHDNNVRGKGSRDALYTANLNVTYRAPVPAPSDIMVKSWLVKRQGRKWYSKGQIVDKEDTVLAEADGLWVSTKRQKL